MKFSPRYFKVPAPDETAENRKERGNIIQRYMRPGRRWFNIYTSLAKETCYVIKCPLEKQIDPQEGAKIAGTYFTKNTGCR
ncbi:hypothetical protein ACT9XH_08055 [Methanococcoides methylutens]|uniref:hypothetical protein n=1 Tax=Methanococcoides methylutens TaxID=2226 RepID=UPI004044C63F